MRDDRGAQRLAVVVAPGSLDPMMLRDALAPVCEPVWVVSDAAAIPEESLRLLRRLGEVVDARGCSAEDAAFQLEGSGAAGIVGFVDAVLPTVSELGTRLGFRCNPPAVTVRLTDKLEQRRALEAAGVPTPGFRAVWRDVSPGDLGGLLSGLRFPVVVKPFHGTASLDVCRADDLASVRDALRAYRAGPRDDALLVEEMIPGAPVPTGVGDYLSVESYVEDGRTVSLGVSARFPLAPPFRETGVFVPAPFPADLLVSAVALAEEAVSGIGVLWGPVHTEMKLSPDGPRVIEVNGRLGGGGILEVWSGGAGLSLLELAARNLLPGQPPLRELVALAGGGALRPALGFFYSLGVLPPLDAGEITAIGDLGAVRRLHGVEEVMLSRAVGDRVDWRSGYLSHVLAVRGRAADLDEISRLPALVEAEAGIRYGPPAR